MKIRVLFFASARDAVGASEIDLNILSGASIDELLEAPELAGLKPLAPSLRYALNEEFSKSETALNDGDVVAVIPPVSGG